MRAGIDDHVRSTRGALVEIEHLGLSLVDCEIA